MEERLPRRLAAILYADVADYSRLTGEDEEATHRVLTEYLDLIANTIESHRGKVMHYAGDAVLAKFDAVVDALSSAVTIQSEISTLNEDVPRDRKVQFRIGVNLGDVIEDRGDIYGDGVNVAARLESLAQPGGICISESVRIALGNKLPLEFECMGEQAVKNIAEPVMAYRAAIQDSIMHTDTEQRQNATELREKPSIAVLPFVNLSSDAEQEYFSDGITEDIITELSRFQSLIVVGRNSSFTYKGKSASSQEISRNLGVRYILEGSVRKAGDRVRVTVQLIEGTTGTHIWAERYDRDLADIFELQDELTQAIVATLPRQVEIANVQRVRRTPPSDQGLYDRLLHAKFLHHRGAQDDNEKARRLLNEAIEIDSEFAPAWAWKTCVVNQAVVRGYIEWSDHLESEMFEWVQKGYTIDENDLESVRILCECYMEQTKWDEAQRFHEKAYQLTPNDPRILAQRGELLTWLGQPEEAVGWIEKAMQLDPYYADDWAHIMGQALFGSRRYEGSIQAFMRVRAPRYNHHAYMAACYAYLGSADQANTQAQKTLEMKKDFSAKAFVQPTMPPPLYNRPEEQVHLLEGLKKAGLPE